MNDAMGKRICNMPFSMEGHNVMGDTVEVPAKDFFPGTCYRVRLGDEITEVGMCRPLVGSEGASREIATILQESVVDVSVVVELYLGPAVGWKAYA